MRDFFKSVFIEMGINMSIAVLFSMFGFSIISITLRAVTAAESYFGFSQRKSTGFVYSLNKLSCSLIEACTAAEIHVGQRQPLVLGRAL